MLTAEAVKKYARECGADIVGISSMDRFEGAPLEMDGRQVFPRGKSLIGLVFRIPRGYIRGVEEGTHFFQYPALGYGNINESIAPTTLYKLGKFIEDQGYEACVFRNTGGRGSVSDMTGKPTRDDSPEVHDSDGKAPMRRGLIETRPPKDGASPPDVMLHFRLAAFICGLGEIGYNKMFLTPQFGPMQRFAFLITDAPLEEDPLYDGEPLCNRCMACVRQCPGSCISPTETVKVNIAGREVEWGKLDEWSCFAYYLGAAKSSNPFLPPDAYDHLPYGKELRAGKMRVTSLEYRDISNAVKAHYANEIGGYNPPKCGGCLRACLASLDARKVLDRTFVERFRTRKPWSVADKSNDC